MMRLIILAIFFLFQFGAAQHRTQVMLSPFGNENLKTKIEKNASAILTEFNIAYTEKRFPDIQTSNFNGYGSKAIRSLWHTKPFYCDETELISNIVRRSDGNYELRNIPLVIKLDNGSLQSEAGVLIFSPSGIINNLYFGIDQHKYQQILREGKTVTDFRRRQIILDFAENFRTAYNRKDISYIQNVFSENALIIVGRVLRPGEDRTNYIKSSIGEKSFELVIKSKKEYITSLKSVFRANSFVKVGFDEIELFKHPVYSDIYGVTLLQRWTSTGYSDVGYIFLMIDFKDEDNPIIHVRTWQPEKEFKREEVFGLGDFEIIR